MKLSELINGAEAVIAIREASDGQRSIYTFAQCPCRNCLMALVQDLRGLADNVEERLVAAEAVADGTEVVRALH